MESGGQFIHRKDYVNIERDHFHRARLRPEEAIWAAAGRVIHQRAATARLSVRDA